MCWTASPVERGELRRSQSERCLARSGSDQAIAASFHHALATKDWAAAKALAPKLNAFPGQSQTQVKKYNLAAYWRLPGHRPDICNGPSPSRSAS